MRKIIYTLFLCASLAIAGCGTKGNTGSASAYTVKDSLGNTVTIPKKPQKVIGSSAFIDTMIVGIVPGNYLVAATEADRDPAISYIAEDTKDISMTVPLMGLPTEIIAQTKPDLIVASTYVKPSELELYKNLGIPVIVLKGPKNIDDVEEDIRILSEALGEKERGEKVISQMKSKLAEVDQKLASVEKKKSAYLVTQMTRFGGPGSMFDDMLTRAKVDNAIGMAGARNGQMISPEMLVKVDPDMFIVSTDRKSDITGAKEYRDAFFTNPAIQNMKAYKNIVKVDDRYIYAADQHAVYGIMALANAAYGPLFDLSDAKLIKGY